MPYCRRKKYWRQSKVLAPLDLALDGNLKSLKRSLAIPEAGLDSCAPYASHSVENAEEAVAMSRSPKTKVCLDKMSTSMSWFVISREQLERRKSEVEGARHLRHVAAPHPCLTCQLQLLTAPKVAPDYTHT